MPLLSLRYKSLCCVSCRECWLCLTRCTALTSFRRNLSLVKELGDRAAQGRAYGNLGNTQYLLGNFSEAIAFHKEVGNRCAFFLGPGAGTGCWGAAFLLAATQQVQGGVCPQLFFSLPCVCQCLALSYYLMLSNVVLQSPSAPNEWFEGRVLLAWKMKVISKCKLQLGLAKLFCS